MGRNYVWDSTNIYAWASNIGSIGSFGYNSLDLFLIMENIDIASYADDNTAYNTKNSLGEVIQKLENAAKTIFQQYSNDQMKANPDKCHFLYSSNREVSLTIENQNIKNSKFKKLLVLNQTQN